MDRSYRNHTMNTVYPKRNSKSITVQDKGCIVCHPGLVFNTVSSLFLNQTKTEGQGRKRIVMKAVKQKA